MGIVTQQFHILHIVLEEMQVIDCVLNQMHLYEKGILKNRVLLYKGSYGEPKMSFDKIEID